MPKKLCSTFVAALRYNLPVGRQVFLLKGSKKPARPFRRGFPLLSASPWADEYLFSFYYKVDKYSPTAYKGTFNKYAGYYQTGITHYVRIRRCNTLLCTNKCKTPHFYGRIGFIEDDKPFQHFYKSLAYQASSFLFFAVNTFLPGHQNAYFRDDCLPHTY